MGWHYPGAWGGDSAWSIQAPPPTPVVTIASDHGEDGADATTYTFSAKAIGAASPGRHVLVGVTARHATITPNIISCTIGGIAATACGNAVEQETGTRQQFFIANVPTGTTADVVLVWDQTCVRCVIGVWALTGLLSTTPQRQGSDSDIGGSHTYSGTLLSISNGAAVFAIAYFGAASTAVGWTELTEVTGSDVQLESQNFSAANKDYAVGGTPTIAAQGTTSAATGGLRYVALR